MFAATITPQKLESAFQPVNALVEECKLHVTPDGITVTAVDAANVGMVDLNLPATVFDSYEATDHTLGLPLGRFLDIVTLFTQKDDPAHIILDEETRKLRLEAGGLDYTLSLIDPDSIRKEPRIPDLDLTAEVVLTGKEFSRAVNACDMVADHLTLGSDSEEEVFFVSAEGDTDSVNLRMGEDEVQSLNPGDAHSLFNLDYLKDMQSPIEKDTPVTIEVGVEFPVLLTFNVVDDQGSVQFVLAPRITDD